MTSFLWATPRWSPVCCPYGYRLFLLRREAEAMWWIRTTDVQLIISQFRWELDQTANRSLFFCCCCWRSQLEMDWHSISVLQGPWSARFCHSWLEMTSCVKPHGAKTSLGCDFVDCESYWWVFPVRATDFLPVEMISSVVQNQFLRSAQWIVKLMSQLCAHTTRNKGTERFIHMMHIPEGIKHTLANAGPIDGSWPQLWVMTRVWGVWEGGVMHMLDSQCGMAMNAF